MIREMVRNYTYMGGERPAREHHRAVLTTRGIVSRVHPDLGWLWDRLEAEHATCFSIVGGGLYVYGGIYHDAIWLSPPGLAGVVRAGTYDLVFEERPSGAAEPRVGDGCGRRTWPQRGPAPVPQADFTQTTGQDAFSV